MNRRRLRASLGSRTSRRAGTKRHTQRLNKVKGSVARQTASKLNPKPSRRLAKLLREA